MKNIINIFEIWKLNGERTPFKVRLDSWSDELGHYALVEEIIIGKWPYGKAYGQYFFYGKPGERGLIRNSGTGRWKLVE